MRYIAAFLLCVLSVTADAQEWIRFNRLYDNTEFSIPVSNDMMRFSDFNESGNQLRMHYLDACGEDQIVPFSLSYLSSIGFVNGIADEEKGHNKGRVFTMNITTIGAQPIDSKEDWVECFISIDGKGEYSDYSGPARIKGRGNSTWEWYDKKPYKFKLDTKSKLLGMDKAKNWNLLANFRDVTKLMNTHAFNVARYMGMPNTVQSRNLEVFLNGDYVGLYQLTEKIEVGKNRVDINEDGGIMLSLDADDGPELSPRATDNFWSKVYSLPISVKYPDDVSADSLALIRTEFAVLEKAIKASDYTLVDSLMDIPSYISLIQLHEYLYNVEIAAPRSIYLYKDKGGKYTWGPVWDWDAGYDFDWGTMYDGHTYFTDYRELILGTDPYKNKGAAYTISGFWRDMFRNKTFVAQYKASWFALSDSMYKKPWSITEEYQKGMVAEGYDRDAARWPLKSWTTTKEVRKMKTWLQNRLAYLNPIIDNYPDGEEEVITDYEICGTLKKTVDCSFRNGYSQREQISISQSEVNKLLGGNPTSLVPLNSDLTEGSNTAAGIYGAWFDAYGDTNQWAVGHVYIESNDLWTWNFGCHPDNCSSNDIHTARMQYRLNKKAVNVEVIFNLK